MNTHFNSANNFNELLFENKNKAYGAYAIRKSESDNITISMLVTSAFFGLLVVTAITLTNTKIEIPDIGINETPQIYLGPEIEIPKPIEQPKAKVETAAPKSVSGAYVASSDPQKTDLKPNDQQLISANPNPNGSDSAKPKGPDVFVVPPLIPEKTPEAVKFAEVMPKLDNMAQFIANNLKYPRQAVDNGTEGTVYVTFVVERDGSISDIKLLKGIGDGCEEEAMRVVAKMPKWEPGTQKNVPQRVQCNLPIKFRIK
jgi:protein TonB